MMDHAFEKANGILQDIKKVGCTTQIIVREMLSFTDCYFCI